jgi:tRNA-splicing ligase RtcB
MISIKNEKGVVTKVFAETFEYEAYSQIKKLANFEAYQNSKIRVMPDAHAGKGCTVGTTMTITDKITPNLVGVDIGCGMLTVKLKDTDIDFKKLDDLIHNRVPHGFSTHVLPYMNFDLSDLKCKKFDIRRATLSLGSLGGGNHFIEIAKSEMFGDYYLIIHSGSRKLGADICKYYQDEAFQMVNEMSRIKEVLIKKLKDEGRQKDIDSELKRLQKPSADKELAYLSGESMSNYLHDLKIAQEYASLNRKAMSLIIISGMGFEEKSRFETIHNYFDFKRNILRKGAVSAESCKMLLIPINMRDGSLICIGKGNEDWNYSAPHGAGRLMSRNKAKELISIDEYESSMKGIHSTSVCQSTLDEAPQAYKSMNEIERLIDPTAEVVDVLKPVYNFKSH